MISREQYDIREQIQDKIFILLNLFYEIIEPIKKIVKIL